MSSEESIVSFVKSSGRKIVIGLLLVLMMSGCSGRLVCEYESEDERFEKLIRKTLENENGSNERAEIGAVQDYAASRGGEVEQAKAGSVGNRRDYCYAQGADRETGEVRWLNL